MADERCAFFGFMSLQRQNNPPPVGWLLNRREISVRGRDKRKETISGMKRKKKKKIVRDIGASLILIRQLLLLKAEKEIAL